MVKKIEIMIYEIVSGEFNERGSFLKKGADEVIKIGRDKINDICSRKTFNFVSREHGKLFVEERMGILIYEDTSRLGTTILQWNRGNLQVESRFVKGKQVAVNSGEWIMIVQDGINGLILIPFFV